MRNNRRAWSAGILPFLLLCLAGGPTDAAENAASSDITKSILEAIKGPDYSNFYVAVDKSDLLDHLDEQDSVFVLAPKNRAWDDLSGIQYKDLFNPDNKDILNGIVACQIIIDPNWSSAIKLIAEQKSGQYNTTTAGGCSISAKWQDSSIYITQYDSTSVISEYKMQVEAYTAPDFPGLGIINGVFSVPTGPSGEPDQFELQASRIFAGPKNFPPKKFAAYGLVAFNSLASDENNARYSMFCKAYVNSVPLAAQLTAQRKVPLSQQMGTVWPVMTDERAEVLNKGVTDSVCADAVKYYNLVTSQSAIANANAAGANLTGNGPFLLAWSPPTDMGKPAAIVLIYDLSAISTYDQALEAMQTWTNAIEGDSELWHDGFSIEGLRRQLEYIVDRVGLLFYSQGT